MKTVLFLLIVSAPSTVFAQSSIFENYKNLLITKGEHFRSIPKKRALNETELSQVPLLECVREFAEHKRGGVAGAEKLSLLLNPLMVSELNLTSDQALLESATNACHELLAQYSSERSTETKDLLLVLNGASKVFLKRFYSPIERCHLKAINANAGIFLSGGAGVGIYRCENSSGRVRNFAGPIVAGGFGFGSAFVQVVSDSTGNTTSGKWFKAGVSESHIEIAAGLGKGIEYNLYNWDEGVRSTVDLGLGFLVTNGIATAMVRVPGGGTRWDLFFDRIRGQVTF